ncbi:hypothetical protein D3C87_1807670 [compost metagenome]
MYRRLRRRTHSVVGAIQGDRWNGDDGLLGKLRFDAGIGRITRHQGVAVPVRVDYHFDEIRVVEGCSALLESGIIEAPGR